MRVSRNNPDTESIGAALRGRHRPFINVITVAARVPSFRQNGNRGVAQRIILRLSVASLHPHMFRVDGTEMDLGRDLERISHWSFLSVLVINLHVADAHSRPILSDSRLPLT